MNFDQVRNFKVWQTYKGCKKMNITTDLPVNAASCYAETECKQRDFSVFFSHQWDNDTKCFHNNELGTIYVITKES